jgi:hypothetical protein
MEPVSQFKRLITASKNRLIIGDLEFLNSSQVNPARMSSAAMVPAIIRKSGIGSGLYLCKVNILIGEAMHGLWAHLTL